MRYHFDHNSGAPADPRVLEVFQRIETDCPGNAGSLHQLGRRARGILEDARDRVAERFAVDAAHVFFVSGGTEANNIAVFGSGEAGLPVLCAAIEHPSVLACAEQRGVVMWRVDAAGRAIIEAPTQPVGLVALVHGQNEVGTLQPLEAARAVADEIGVPMHVDASQTLGRIPVQAAVAMADSVTFSAHKVGGIRGMGVLIDKSSTTRPRFFGGGQQSERRPGTEAVGLTAATATAIELALDETEQRAHNMRAARDAFAAELAIEGVRQLTPEDSLPNTSMLCFAAIDGRTLLPALDMAGVEASQGSACSSGTPTPPPVLRAMGLDDHAARACVRFSFSWLGSVEAATQGAQIVKQVVHGLRTS